MEAFEREAEGANEEKEEKRHVIKFHALHAFNRLLEAFPDIVKVSNNNNSIPLMLDVCARELLPSSTSASSISSPSLLPSPGYGTKLLETLGLILATQPSSLLSQSHIFILKGL